MSIVVEGLVKRFGAVTVIDRLSCVVPDRSLTAVVGPSGCGKSTLLSVAAGLEAPTSGRVERDGRPVDRRSAVGVAWVTQTSSVLPFRSAIDNVAIGALAAGATQDHAEWVAREALETVGLTQLASIDTRCVSGGERQRIAVARALASGLPEVFADEPTAHLDAASTGAVIEALRSISAHRLVLVATHDLALAEAADNIVLLRPTRPDPT